MKPVLSIPVLGLVLLSVSALGVEDKKKAAAEATAKVERELMAKEDEIAAKLGSESNSPLVNFYARGKLRLFPADDPLKTADVVGEFTTPQQTFLVKVASDKVLKDLQSVNGKETTLMGKQRADGKYFIVDGLGGGGAPPVAKTNRKRI